MSFNPATDYLDLTCLAQVKRTLSRDSVHVTDDEEIRAVITELSRSAAEHYLHRAVKTAARVERFDIRQGQKDFFVEGFPIDTTTAPVVVHNTENPRVWTNSSDVVDADYVICDPKRARQGIVHIDRSYNEVPDALQITYTGGMASFTGCDETDGVTTTASKIVTSTRASFKRDGVAAGYKLRIKGGSQKGDYTVATVDSETQITLTAALTATLTDVAYEVLDSNSASFINSYPDIAHALALQAAEYFRNRSVMGQASASMGGVSFSYDRPVNWLWMVEGTLRRYSRGIV